MQVTRGNVAAISACAAVMLLAPHVAARPMHAEIVDKYHRYLEEVEDVANELAEWKTKWGSGLGWIPVTESRSADEDDEDQRQRFFMTKENIKSMQLENPNANFTTDSPFTLMTNEEFSKYVANSYYTRDSLSGSVGSAGSTTTSTRRRLHGRGGGGGSSPRQKSGGGFQRGESTRSSSGFGQNSATSTSTSTDTVATPTSSDAVLTATTTTNGVTTTTQTTLSDEDVQDLMEAANNGWEELIEEVSEQMNESNGWNAGIVYPNDNGWEDDSSTYTPTTTTTTPQTAAPTTAAPATYTPPATTTAPVTTTPSTSDDDQTSTTVLTEAPSAEYDSTSTTSTSASTTTASDADSVDWTNTPCVTPVQDQGQCGSCWSFSTIAAVEIAECIKNGQTSINKYSEQKLVSCDSANLGCNGGAPVYAMEYIQQNGVCMETDYPYTSSYGSVESCGSCTSSNPGVTGYNIISGGESELLSAIATRPVVIAVAAGNNAWKQYSGGVLSTCDSSQVDHAVLAVGYDASTIKIKNSWGSNWGESGYIRLARGGSSYGTCSMLTDMSQVEM